MDLPPRVLESVDSIRRDSTSGAAELLPRVVQILREAVGYGPDATALVARALVNAQPSMAPVLNACAVAIVGGGEALERFAARAARANEAIARHAVAILTLQAPQGRAEARPLHLRADAQPLHLRAEARPLHLRAEARPLHLRAEAQPLELVTLSYSSTVVACLRVLASKAAVRVACGEGRPALEGQRLARTLDDAGIPVDFYTDAALTTALDRDSLVLVGADAIGPDWFVNKCGTASLVALAAARGVPAFVVAGREKCLPGWLAERLRLPEARPEEVWDAAAGNVTVRNPCFERTEYGALAGVITDAGLVAAELASSTSTAPAEPDPRVVAILF